MLKWKFNQWKDWYEVPILYSHQANNRRFVPGGQGWINSRREVKETGGKKKKRKRLSRVSTSITLILPAGVGEITHLLACPEPLIRSQYDSGSHHTVCSPHMLRMPPVNSVLCSSVHYGEKTDGFVCDSKPLWRNVCPFSCCHRQPFSPPLKFNAEVLINLLTGMPYSLQKSNLPERARECLMASTWIGQGRNEAEDDRRGLSR